MELGVKFFLCPVMYLSSPKYVAYEKIHNEIIIGQLVWIKVKTQFPCIIFEREKHRAYYLTCHVVIFSDKKCTYSKEVWVRNLLITNRI